MVNKYVKMSVSLFVMDRKPNAHVSPNTGSNTAAALRPDLKHKTLLETAHY
ncbi:hypothetical protein DPMN_106741 [Dreissena polymorpha]|uniref:Uncharacterized protein n=1 Tax=Dreissena polymorpha TaxID=45954 RepID=A0A9D4QJ60_DREPO|nr:hypothetical protein DPMN_106741 [Dreissena polymorpha]